MDRQSDAEVTTLQGEEYFDKGFRHMIDTFFGGQHGQFCPAERAWNPPADVFETKDAILIKMELAGVRDEDIEVKINDDYLIIRGRRIDQQNVKRENFHLMEIHYGPFERVFRLSGTVQIKDVSATLKNGFLLVTIPKDTSMREYRIEIE